MGFFDYIMPYITPPVHSHLTPDPRTHYLVHRLGLKVAIADISEDKLKDLGKTLAGFIGEANVLIIPTDVSKLEQVQKLRDRVYEAWGEVRLTPKLPLLALSLADIDILYECIWPIS